MSAREKYGLQYYQNPTQVLTGHKRIHTGETLYKCDWYGKAFSISCTLTAHVRIHTGEKPYKCHDYGKIFRKHSHLICTWELTLKKKNLTVVIKMKNPSGEAFPLLSKVEYKMEFSHFGKAFSVTYPLENMTNHTREKPYECNQYRKSFHCSSLLTMNTRVLSGENPYECNKCWKAFISLSFLRQHRRIHTGQKSYECNQWVRGNFFLLR